MHFYLIFLLATRTMCLLYASSFMVDVLDHTVHSGPYFPRRDARMKTISGGKGNVLQPRPQFQMMLHHSLLECSKVNFFIFHYDLVVFLGPCDIGRSSL